MIAAAFTSFFPCRVSTMELMRGRAIAFILVCVFALAPRPALAQPLDDALAKFAADTFNDTEAGINAVAASGNPLAADIIDALQNSRLFFDAATKKIYIRAPDGRMLDASS